MSAGEKMIPKAVLLKALHEILDAARDPVIFQARSFAERKDPAEAQAFTLGYIEATVREALGQNV